MKLLLLVTAFLFSCHQPAKVKGTMGLKHASDKFDSLQIEEMKWKDSTAHF